MIKFRGPNESKPIPAPGGGTRIDYPYPHANVKLLRYPAGTEIPKHSHQDEALHIILKGKATLADGSYTLIVGTDYACGGFEYGPWKVSEDLEMLVVERLST